MRIIGMHLTSLQTKSRLASTFAVTEIFLTCVSFFTVEYHLSILKIIIPLINYICAYLLPLNGPVWSPFEWYARANIGVIWDYSSMTLFAKHAKIIFIEYNIKGSTKMFILLANFLGGSPLRRKSPDMAYFPKSRLFSHRLNDSLAPRREMWQWLAFFIWSNLYVFQTHNTEL